MAHNPILDEQTVPRNPLVGSPHIRMDTTGVLYTNSCFIRRVLPGEQLSRRERLNGGTIYMVDTAMRSAWLDMTIPDSTRKHYFPIRLAFEYQVAIPERMIQPRVANTEALLTRVVEPLLRRECQQRMIVEHEELCQILEILITPALFEDLGLNVQEITVEIRWDEATFQAQLEHLNSLMRPRNLTVKRSAIDRSGKYCFPIKMILEYQPKSLQHALQQHESDEVIISRELDPMLQRLSRGYNLLEYENLIREFETNITVPLLDSLGFKLIRKSVDINFNNDEFQTQVRFLRSLLQPRSLTYDFPIIDRTGKYRFPLQLTISYKPLDDKKMLSQDIAEIERLIEQTLVPLLRRSSRQHSIQDYEQLINDLEQQINPDLLKPLGLALVSHSVEIRSDDEAFQMRLKQLRDLERLNRTSQHRVHYVQLPTSKHTEMFDAQVNVTYSLIQGQLDQLPTDTPAEAEAMLWPKINQILREVSRQYRLGQELVAEREIHEALSKAIAHDYFKEFAISVTNVNVALTPEDRALQYAQDLAAAGHQHRLRILNMEAERRAQALRLSTEGEALKVYSELIERGEGHILALMLTKNPDDVERIQKRLDEAGRERLAVQIRMLESILDKQGTALEPEMVRLFEGIAGTVMGIYKPRSSVPADLSHIVGQPTIDPQNLLAHNTISETTDQADASSTTPAADVTGSVNNASPTTGSDQETSTDSTTQAEEASEPDTLVTDHAEIENLDSFFTPEESESDEHPESKPSNKASEILDDAKHDASIAGDEATS